MATSFNLENFLPRHTKKLLQWRTAQQASAPKSAAGQMRTALQRNENHLGSVGTSAAYHLYPDDACAALRTELAEYHKLSPEQILVGNGSTELFDVILRAFLNPHKDSILTFAPTEHYFRELACLNSVGFHELPLNSFFQLPLHKTQKELHESTKIIIVSNPNRIAGVPLRPFDIASLLETFEGIVVVDESYIDYCLDKSILASIQDYPNLIVVQTFSKAWGLAGLRVGAAFAHPALIEAMAVVKAPFSVNVVAQEIATKALHLPEHKERMVEMVEAERERVRTALELMSFVVEVQDSEANFLLVKVEDAEKTFFYLQSERIDVLWCKSLSHCENALRIGIGTPEQNNRLLQSMREMPAKLSPIRKMLKTITTTFTRASVVLGVFKKFFT